MTYFYIENENENGKGNENENDKGNGCRVECYFFEVMIDEMGLHSSSSYSPEKKDMYYCYPYQLKLAKIVYNKLENIRIETYLDKDKYYLCKYTKPTEYEYWSTCDGCDGSDGLDYKNQILFGFKKVGSDYVIKICDLDPSKKHEQLLEWNPKVKIINLLLEEKIINSL